MRSDIRPGGVFPDYSLPDHTDTVRKLSELQGDDPMVLLRARFTSFLRPFANLEAGMRIVSLFCGDPASYVEQVHDANGVVLQTIGSAEEARRAALSGVDVVVAQGWEAGGQVRGQVATLPLVPAVVDIDGSPASQRGAARPQLGPAMLRAAVVSTITLRRFGS